jgi:hypothetical protein
VPTGGANIDPENVDPEAAQNDLNEEPIDEKHPE